MQAAQHHDQAEHRIGKYVIVGRIGKGGMGMVYRGLDEALEREVAIKTLTAEGSLDEESRARFQIEAKAAARLQHPNIVTIYESGEDRGLAYIAMELLPGADLESLLRSGEPLLLQEKLEIVLQICRGMAYAHEHGIVHRDIKPANIHLLDDGTVKIMDFGIAKVGGSGVTKVGMLIGTLSYMSPEQIRGQALDGRSDVFSVGVILFQLLAGKRPFPGQGSDVLYKIVQEPTPSLDVELGSAGPRLEGLMEKALAKSVDDRYADATELADELQSVLDWYGESAVPPVLEADVEVLGSARRILKDGDPVETAELFEGIVERNPHSLQARRALRAASRALQRAESPSGAADVDYPELDATFGPAATHRSPQTFVQPATERARRPGGGGLALAAVGLLVTVGIGVMIWLAYGSGLFGPTVVRFLAQSEPAGARVFVDGVDTGVITNGIVELERDGSVAQLNVELRRDGFETAAQTLFLPLAEGVSVNLPLQVVLARVQVASDPPGAAIELDGRGLGPTPSEVALDPATAHMIRLTKPGYRSREVQIEAGEPPPELSVTLERIGPPGKVSVTSAYPIDIVLGGKRLATGERSPTVSLPAGRHTLTLRAAAVFLDQQVHVTVQEGGQVRLQTPATGELNVRATPGNCKVFVGTTFVDYPPILNRRIVAGQHTLSFQWPDGAEKKRTVSVKAGVDAYVTERK